MFRIERSDGRDGWTLMMASPYRISIDDLHGPPGPHSINHIAGGDLHASVPSPGNKTIFTGERGAKARVRYDDNVIEEFEWSEIPLNEFDPNSEIMWGWKLIAQNYSEIPFAELWPISFGG